MIPIRRSIALALLLGPASLVALAPPAWAQGPSVQITSAPAFGSSGSIAGQVAGIDFATHEVAVYIQIEGAGWWTKPSFDFPTVPILPDGSFTADVVSGGLDAYATLYHVGLIPAGQKPVKAEGGASAPVDPLFLATHTYERHARTLQFAGRTWAVKSAPTPVGPGSNLFSDRPTDVWVDAQGLHLTISYQDGSWWASEVYLLESLGHGTYTFQTSSRLDLLDIHATFGAFTWDVWGGDPKIAAWPNREIDFEDSSWGNPTGAPNAQAVVQPWTVSGNLSSYTLPNLGANPALTRFFTWRAGQIDFTALTGYHEPWNYSTGDLIHQFAFVEKPLQNNVVPSEGRENFRFNLWLNNVSIGGPWPPQPAGGQPIEVIIRDFDFHPLAAAIPYGCDLNPAGSLTVLAGAPSIGSTVTLGVDNPLGTQPVGSTPALLLALAPDLGAFCGTLLQGFSMYGPGAPGELLVSLVPPDPVLSLIGPGWLGPGNPTAFPIPLPPNPNLSGLSLYTQGLIVDPTTSMGVGIALTEGLVLELGF